MGTEGRSRGPAIYFGVARSFTSDYFDLHDVDSRCVPDAAGRPRSSVCISICRVLEHVPLSVIGNLYLVTRDGRVLEEGASSPLPAFAQKYHLYHEIRPVHPTIVSALDLKTLSAFMTDSRNPIHAPKILFMDLRLGDLADNPATGSARDLPYSQLEHLRACLMELRSVAKKPTKTVDRMYPVNTPFRTIQSGLFLADREQCRYYPFRSYRELQTTYYEWWRSATM